MGGLKSRRGYVFENETKRRTEEEYVKRAIKKLRDKYKGIHTVCSGFNDTLKIYFGTNPVETTQKLSQEGKIVIRPV